MVTPRVAFAMVAQTLAGIDTEDNAAVSLFYQRDFVEYPKKLREMVADFLISQTSVPSDQDLALLRKVVDRIRQRHTRSQ